MRYHARPQGRGRRTSPERTNDTMDILRYLQARLTVNMKSERGAALTEYALLLALIAVVCMVAIGAIGTQGKAEFEEIGASLAK